MLDLYDKEGKLIDSKTWARLHGTNYRIIGRTTLPDGKRVSTVWLGLNHRFIGEGPPIIFETMVFPEGDSLDLDCMRYCTEEEAKLGHEDMVKKWTLTTKVEEQVEKILKGLDES